MAAELFPGLLQHWQLIFILAVGTAGGERGSYGSCRAEIGGSKYTPITPACPFSTCLSGNRPGWKLCSAEAGVRRTAETQQLSVSFCSLISAGHFRIIPSFAIVLLHVETGRIWCASTFKDSSTPNVSKRSAATKHFRDSPLNSCFSFGHRTC